MALSPTVWSRPWRHPENHMKGNKKTKQKMAKPLRVIKAFSLYKCNPPLPLFFSFISHFFQLFSPHRKMDFVIPKAQRYFSGDDKKGMMNVNSPEEKDTQATNLVSSQLQIKSSARASAPEALDKEVVLRRIRHHRCKNKVKSVFQALVGSSGQAQDKWMELGDAFTCP